MTGFVYDPIFLQHETGAHPENGGRMTATVALLRESGLLARLAPEKNRLHSTVKLPARSTSRCWRAPAGRR